MLIFCLLPCYEEGNLLLYKSYLHLNLSLLSSMYQPESPHSLLKGMYKCLAYKWFIAESNPPIKKKSLKIFAMEKITVLFGLHFNTDAIVLLA